MDLEISNNINQNLDLKLKESQNSFLESNLGKAINNAVDVGIKAVLPNLIENEVIDVKNAILENGFKEGIKQVIDSAIDLGKSAIGITTGNFENINQIELAVKKGGILDKISDLLDFVLNVVNNKNLINKSTMLLIKNGKNSIISSISNKIEETLTNQIKAVEKLEKYCENWNIAYGNKDISNMEKAYKNIKNYLSKTIPLEKIINNAREIENKHKLIKSKGNEFNLTENELILSQKIK